MLTVISRQFDNPYFRIDQETFQDRKGVVPAPVIHKNNFITLPHLLHNRSESFNQTEQVCLLVVNWNNQRNHHLYSHSLKSPEQPHIHRKHPHPSCQETKAGTLIWCWPVPFLSTLPSLSYIVPGYSLNDARLGNESHIRSDIWITFP